MTLKTVGYRFNVSTSSGEIVSNFFKDKPIGITDCALEALVLREDVKAATTRIETLEQALKEAINGIAFAIEQLEQRNDVIKFLQEEINNAETENEKLAKSRDNFRHGFHGAVDTLFDNLTIQETANET